MYAYDTGYCAYFDIPRSLIVISVPNLILIAVIGIFVLMMLSDMVRSLSVSAAAVIDAHEWARLTPMAVLIMILGVILVMLPKADVPKIIAFCLLIAFAAIVIVVTMRRILKRLRSVDKPTAPPLNLLDALVPRQLALFLTVVPFVAFVIGCAAMPLGWAHAKGLEWFPLTAERQPKVILAVFGDEIIAANYDSKTRAITPTLTLYNTAKYVPTFSEVNTGPVVCDCPR